MYNNLSWGNIGIGTGPVVNAKLRCFLRDLWPSPVLSFASIGPVCRVEQIVPWRWEAESDAISFYEEKYEATTVGTIKSSETYAIVAYPNPSHGKFQVRVTGSVSGVVINVSVYDLFGNKVAQGDTANDLSCSFDMDSCIDGIYFLKVEDGDKFSIKKILISR